MNAQTTRVSIPGPAGTVECAMDEPATPAAGLALLCHPHPLHGGTLDNKVVQTLARAAVACGWRAIRFNFRGVGGSSGQWDEGRGEVDDALAVLSHFRTAAEPLVLGGFSFGGYVASQVAARVHDAAPARRLLLVAPAAQRFALAPVPEDTLVVHGELDDVVPLSAVLDWARPQSLPVTVVPGAGHFFHGQLPLLRRILTSAWP